jgi:ribosome-associated protein
MPRKKKKTPNEHVLEAALAALSDKKARNTVVLDFTKMKDRVSDAFIICHGTSRTQVEALADHVVNEIKVQTGENPWHREGFKNAEWILIDYSDIVIHIFQEERRKFYNLEQLWADADLTQIGTPENQS